MIQTLSHPRLSLIRPSQSTVNKPGVLSWTRLMANTGVSVVRMLSCSKQWEQQHSEPGASVAPGSKSVVRILKPQCCPKIQL